MNSNGYITAPISLKDDVYHVLNITPSGAYYDLAEVCMNNSKIQKWSKYKPYITEDDTYEPISYEQITLPALYETDIQSANGNLLAPDGTEVTVTKDPSKAISGRTYWGLNPGTTNQPGKELKSWITSLYPSWYYNAPQTDNWKRLTDFELYNHNAGFPITIWPHTDIQNLIRGNKIYTVNLFPNLDFDFWFQAAPIGTSNFVSALEFFQKDPRLRFTVEVWPANSAAGSWFDAEYPGEMLGKWFSKALYRDTSPTFAMGVRQFLDTIYGADNYWHMGGSETHGGYTFNIVLGFQEAVGEISADKEIWFIPNNNYAHTTPDDFTGELITDVTQDPSLAGTGVISPGLVEWRYEYVENGSTVSQYSPGQRWPINIGCWFDRDLTNVKWGYTPPYSPYYKWNYGESESSTATQHIVNRTLYLELEMETKGGDSSLYSFILKSANSQSTGNSVKIGALLINDYQGYDYPIIAEVVNVLDSSLDSNGEWDGTGTAQDTTIPNSTGTKKLYLRFPDFWGKPSSGEGCKIRLMASLAENPNSLGEDQGDYLHNWFDINTSVTMADGTTLSGSIIQTDVYYESNA